MEPLQALLEQMCRERDLDLSSYKPAFLARRLAGHPRARERDSRDCPMLTIRDVCGSMKVGIVPIT